MIVVTILVRVILFPLSLGAARTQIGMQEINPKLEKLRTELKNDKEALARETMALFREHKINPLSSIFLLLLQIPIIIGLYSVFLKEAQNTGLYFDPALLYDFVSPWVSSTNPPSFNFLGLIDLKAKSIVLAVLVAISQYLFMQVAMPQKPKPTGNAFRDDLSQSMHVQMRYVFPFVMGFIAYATGGAVALYFLVSNIFGTAQTAAVKKIHDNNEKRQGA
jgi:YidC/Oxa1 family membrane protein insertase